ncbi:MAG: hypothetical protein MJE63_08340 [Proteobacteria bacterium]|nr:hypothetical protein [Pseudomonadota bacterium]
MKFSLIASIFPKGLFLKDSKKKEQKPKNQYASGLPQEFDRWDNSQNVRIKYPR